MSGYEFNRASTQDSAGILIYASEHIPSYSACRNLLLNYDYIPLFASLEIDLDVVDLYQRLAGNGVSVLFEIAGSGGENGCYSVIAIDPFFYVSYSQKKSRCDNLAPFLRSLKTMSPELPFYSGGPICVWGYDVGLSWQGLIPRSQGPMSSLPDMFFFLPRTVVVYGHQERLLTVVCWLAGTGDFAPRDYEEACSRIELVISAAETVSEVRPSAGELKGFDIKTSYPDPVSSFKANISPGYFKEMVTRVKTGIGKGDIFQAVISQRWERRSGANPWDTYLALRRLNPSPYMFYLEGPDYVLLGSSPETQISVTGRKVTVRPIAGTRRLTGDRLSDRRAYEELTKDEKERAEHVMLVDLARNDLGRICETGSIKLSHFMIPQSYSHVVHLVSAVEGILRPQYDALDAFRSCFPAGTLSGAPKRKAMEIINTEEKDSRGFYGGAIGLAGFNGDLDSAIIIRSAVYRQGVYYLQSGAGIVADSDPEMEYQETLNKARAVAMAVLEAEGKA